uniref:Uncharacterized protein n=1 Tax=Cannabis sativa TaxID=3483 RepID=A0A803Q6B4_CANSA
KLTKVIPKREHGTAIGSFGSELRRHSCGWRPPSGGRGRFPAEGLIQRTSTMFSVRGQVKVESEAGRLPPSGSPGLIPFTGNGSWETSS